MPRFEVSAALVMGIALPVLETARRRTDFGTIAFYIDDYIAGGLLLWAAYAVYCERRYGRRLLAAAWGVLCGGLYSSFFGQIERGAALDVSGFSNGLVVVVKGILFSISITALVLSVRERRKPID